jgi:hypothetical protein
MGDVRSRSPVARVLWLALALLCAGVALVGVVVPVLPSAPFALVAAYGAARGSTRFHAWLLGHRSLGPLIRDWELHRAVSRRAKRLALAVMVLSGLASVLLAPSPAIAAAAVVALASAATWLWLRPEPPVAE